jgi:PleD family two-component response regulator
VPHGITFSMGGTEASASRDFDALLGEADQRLYAAKAAGRATWR